MNRSRRYSLFLFSVTAVFCLPAVLFHCSRIGETGRLDLDVLQKNAGRLQSSDFRNSLLLAEFYYTLGQMNFAEKTLKEFRLAKSSLIILLIASNVLAIFLP